MKMKKQNLIALLLCVCMIIGLTIPILAAETVDFKYEVNDSEKRTIKITGTKQGSKDTTGVINIPKTIDGYTVTEIGKSAFKSYRKITSVSIPDTVTKIGSKAFESCTSMKTFKLSNKVTSIGDDVFFDCSALQSIAIPSSLTKIGAADFGWCTSLKEIKVDKNNENFVSVNGVLFKKDMKTIIAYPNARSSTYKIPDGVTEIDRFAFCGCTKLTSVTIPKSVTTIHGAAFNACTSLTSITIPDSVSIIREGAFDGCTSLKSITIPNSVTELGDHVFIGCSALTSVTLSNRVTSLGNQVFRHCKSLKSVTIPGKVKSIGNNAFQGCRALESVIIPSSVASIGEYAFRSCPNLKISVTAKSAAHQYAIDNDIPFVLSKESTAKTVSKKLLTDKTFLENTEFRENNGTYTSRKTTEDVSGVGLELSLEPTDVSALADINVDTYIEFDVHINDVSLCGEYLVLEITSSGTYDEDEYQWGIEPENLKSGWNTIKCSVFDNPISIVGKPDLKKIDFIRIFMIECEPGLQLKIENLRIVSYGE